MKFFISVLLVMVVGAITGPIGGGLIIVALFIAEEVNNTKLTKQREEHEAYEARLLNELNQIKQEEKIKEEIKIAAENLKKAVLDNEINTKKKISKNETIYMMRGKRHIFDGENFIEIDSE